MSDGVKVEYLKIKFDSILELFKHNTLIRKVCISCFIKSAGLDRTSIPNLLRNVSPYPAYQTTHSLVSPGSVRIFCSDFLIKIKLYFSWNEIKSKPELLLPFQEKNIIFFHIWLTSSLDEKFWNFINKKLPFSYMVYKL